METIGSCLLWAQNCTDNDLTRHSKIYFILYVLFIDLKLLSNLFVVTFQKQSLDLFLTSRPDLVR